jgi:hypothetical protein
MKLNTYKHSDYSGGLNDTDDPRQIERNQAALLRNWLVREKGKLIRRDGLTQAGDTLSGYPYMLAAFLKNDGNKDILVMDGTTLKYLNSTVFSSLDTGFTGAIDYTWANLTSSNKIYFGNEDNTIHYWDRSSTTTNSCLTDLGALKPHGNIMVWYKNHMFHLNNVNVNGTKYPTWLYWSALGDPETYDTSNDKANLPYGGRLITAAPLGESALVIFQEHAIKFLSGYGDTEWAVSASANNYGNIDESVGCVSPYGVTNVRDEIWFIDDEANIRRLYTTDFGIYRKDIVSSNIQGTLADINKSQLAKAKAWTHNDYVFFAFPDGTDQYNSIVCVFDLIAAQRNATAGKKYESWTTITGWSPSFFLSYPTTTTPDLYIANYTDKKIYKWYGDNDGSTAVDARWDSKIDDYDGGEKYKRYKYGYIRGIAASGDVDVGIYASIDSGSFAHISDLNLEASGSRLGPTGTDTLGPTGTFYLGGATEGDVKFYYTGGGGSASGRSVQHSIRHAVADEKPEVKNFISHFKMRAIR